MELSKKELILRIAEEEIVKFCSNGDMFVCKKQVKDKAEFMDLLHNFMETWTKEGKSVA